MYECMQRPQATAKKFETDEAIHEVMNRCSSGRKKIQVYITEDEDGGPEDAVVPLGCPAIGGAV